MQYLYSILIAIVLFFLEVSFLPHLMPWLLVPFLVLPFISIISLKDRTIYPIFLAGALGILTDSLSGSIIPVYSIAYISIALISKIFHGKFTSYGELRANLINMSVGFLVIYGTDIAYQISYLNSFSWLISSIFKIGFALITLLFYFLAGRKYFSWVEKETEERFR